MGHEMEAEFIKGFGRIVECGDLDHYQYHVEVYMR